MLLPTAFLCCAASFLGQSLPAEKNPELVLFVAPGGSPNSNGSFEAPFATLSDALQIARKARSEGHHQIEIYLRGGIYYLDETLVFQPNEFASNSHLLISAWKDEQPILSGGQKLELDWIPFRDGIAVATVPAGTTTDQLFVDGIRQPMARYPNFDPKAQILGGTAADAFSSQRAAAWSSPEGGFMHAMHSHMWGDFHYRILGKKSDGSLEYEGGWQNNRQSGMHKKFRMVENVFEELDAPGEWFLDQKQTKLYYYPALGVDLKVAKVEGVRLPHLLEIRGSEKSPVRNIELRGLHFQHAARTFMDNKEPLLRSDWTCYRGGAVVMQGAENIVLTNCLFDQVGGNAIFVDGYNRKIAIRGCHIKNAGANSIAFVGKPEAVRNPLFEYGQRLSFEDLDLKPGPKTKDYPADCLVEDCLLTGNGRFEKQTAGVQIAMARRITVRHCSIYDTPRAGINIGDGCWGGHLIEENDVFDTVKETGDHGSFNSWGRDRFWGLKGFDLHTVTLGDHANLPKLDMVEPNILRNNRWRCDRGWDIDLDDGSSNYLLENNLCLNGGIKLREGFYRVVKNNIMVGNSFHPHVWYRNSQDVFKSNIVFTAYKPIRVPLPWGKQCDQNLLHNPGATGSTAASQLMKQSGLDQTSLVADALFLDPAQGDYRVQENSPALQLGFRNFPMDEFGVISERLRAIAKTPVLPIIQGQAAPLADGPKATNWRGAQVIRLAGREQLSAVGLGVEGGALILAIPKGCAAEALGLQKADVILEIAGKRIASPADLPSNNVNGVVVWRRQARVEL